MKNILITFFLVFSSMLVNAQNLEDLTYGTDNSLEVITWNIQFFPLNDDVTINYISQIIQALDADIIAFQEVADVAAFSQMIDEIDGYDSHVGTTDDLIKLAYVYKTDVIQANSIYEIYTGSEYYLPFLRRPLVMEFTYDNEDFIVINNHFKAMGDGILDLDDPNDEENRRWVATNLIKEYIDDNFPNDKVIILGDLNDVVTDDYDNNVFQSILDDPLNYVFADYSIATGSQDNWSYPNYPSHIDHIIITNELFSHFYTHTSGIETLKIEDYLSGGWNDYTQDISDHRPVAIKLFMDENLVLKKDFEDQSLTSGGWTSYNVTGAQVWTVPDTQYGHNNSYCAFISGYDNGFLENENWLVSPGFSPADYDHLRLSFWNTSAYTGPALQLFYSNDFSDNPLTATWTEIDDAVWHDGADNWVWTYSEVIDLSNLPGATTHIAFKYTSTNQESASWEIDDILLSDAPNTCFISAGVSPANSGSVTGTGTFTYGETVVLTASAETDYSFVNWTENGTVVSTNPEYSFEATSDKNIVANFSNPVDVIDLNKDSDISIYPNPSQGIVVIDGNSIQKIEIFNVLGSLIKSINVSSNKTILNLENFEKGIYIFKMITDQGITTSKVLLN
ncbi:MAG: choice-of-anchor J domain-containing protein [Bacteroidales bacterium]